MNEVAKIRTSGSDFTLINDRSCFPQKSTDRSITSFGLWMHPTRRMRLTGRLQLFRLFAPILGICFSAISAEPESGAKQENLLDGQKLMAIRGLPLTHKLVRDVMSSKDFRKLQTIRDEIHHVEIDGINQGDRIEITTHFLATDKTVEIIVKEVLPEDQVFSRRPYVDLIRVGLPRAGAAYPFALAKMRGLSLSQATEFLTNQTLRAEPLFPYGIVSSMTPEQIHKLCDRPYATGTDLTGKSGNGIKFFEDPISPFPITVWFEKGTVIGIDIHTWGPRSQSESVTGE